MIQRFDAGKRMSEATVHGGIVYLAGQVPEDTSADAEGQTRQVLSEIDALLAKALGSTVPVSGLVYWLKGQVGPVPAQVTERDDQGRPLSFVQDGWRVQLSRYDDQGPMLLRMNRSQANRSISVRLVVDPS